MEKNSRIYVAGHRGLVGSAIVRNLEANGFTNIITRTHVELDLTNQDDVRKFFEEERPEYVFLAAAKVGGIHANNTYPADFIYDNLGINAFNNYSFEDNKFIERFHPTIYDSIMISTLRNISIGLNINNLLDRKMILLQNEDYRTYISERTTNVDHIRGRIEKASEILYG